MPKTHEMKESKFLKKEDVGVGALLTITGCVQRNVAKEGVDPEMKWCLTFKESDKPLVLNQTNIQVCEAVFGSDDTDDWPGKQIVLFNDPNVSFGGKLTGGIRVRAPRKPAEARKPVTAALPPELPAEPLTADDIPFGG